MSHAGSIHGPGAHGAHAGHAADAHGNSHGHGVNLPELLREDNVYAPGFKAGLAAFLMLLGVAGLAGALIGWLTGVGEGEHGQQQALFSYHVGAIVVLGLCLGPLGVVMIFNQVSSGWSVTLRRQFENAASLIWLPFILLLPSVVLGGSKLFHWMAPHAAGDPVLKHKWIYFFGSDSNVPWFFYLRFIFYFVIWGYLATRLFSLSRQQDESGDKWLTNKAKFTSAWGLLAFALTVAFASFDLLKSLDYHWFSTMFGVYFFAGNMFAGLGLMAVVFSLIRSSGKLKGLVTAEHFHDHGKLMLGFTVFWAYIAFSQYFLIWYANIPEETAWMSIRQSGGWEKLGLTMMFGHFLGPFLVMLFRGVKRSLFLGVMGAWMLAMHCVDIFWVVRPIPFAADPIDTMHISWIDFAGVLGPVCLFLGLLIWRIGRGPLIPLKDPFLIEAAQHKNYV